MRIATYNFCRGGKEDYQTLYRVLDMLEPDILLAQETCNPELYLAKNAAYWAARNPPIYHWTQTAHTYWGSAVYAKDGRSQRTIALPDALRGWVVGIEFSGITYPEACGLPLRIISIHTPTRDHGNYSSELARIVDAIASLATDCVLVVGGDFNVTVSPRHASESRRDVPAEQAVIAQLHERLGLINCWQVAHPDHFLDPTFHAGILPTPAFHIDGIFVPKTWQKYLRQCEIISPPQHQRSEGDHYPMIADFDLEAEEARIS